MRPAVTGAGGFLAGNLRRLLHGMGVPAVVISRREVPTHPLETLVTTKGYDAAEVGPALKSCSCVFHLAGTGREADAAAYAEANAGVTSRVTDACRGAGVPGIIYCSGLGASRERRGRGAYFESKEAAERIVVESGLRYTIFRPSYIVGNGDPLTRNLREQAAGGAVTVPGPGPFLIQPILVDDAVRIMAQAAADPRFFGRILDMVGPRAVPFEWFVRRVVGNAAPVSAVPLERAYEMAARGSKFPYGTDDLDILDGSFTGNFEEIGRLAGFDFATPEEISESCRLS